MLLEPVVEAVVDLFGQAGVLHPQFAVQLDGAGVLFPQFVAHGAGEQRLGGRLVLLLMAAGVEELLVEAVFPEVQQPQFCVIRFANRVVRLSTKRRNKS